MRYLILLVSLAVMAACDKTPTASVSAPNTSGAAKRADAPTRERSITAKPSTVETVGSACVVDSSAAKNSGVGDLTAGTMLAAEVIFNECASACSKVLEAKCEVTRSGTDIVVDGVLTVAPPKPGTVCQSSCAVHSARCDMGTLKPGTYSLTYGESTAEFSVPGKGVCTP